MKQKAVITGDLVSSQKIKALLREELYNDIDAFAKSLKRKWISSYERFRGDSIQCVAVQTGLSLRVALMIRCFVKSYQPSETKKKSARKGYTSAQFNIRLSIGIGTIDFINEKKLSSSDGEAFVLSGLSLDELKKNTGNIVVKTNNIETNTEWELIIALLDAIIEKWTRNGAELVLQKLMNKRDDEIAQQLNISLSAVTQRKKIAQWNAVNKAIQYFETKFSNS